MLFTSFGVTVACLAAAAFPGRAGAARHEDLVAFFREWRAFQAPKVVAGVPDYSAAAMAAQQKRARDVPAAARRDRSERLDGPAAGRLPDRAGRARTGLDFDHRVLEALGEQSRLLRHGLRRGERSARARGPVRGRRRRALDVPVPADARRGGEARRGPPRDPRPARARRRRI